MRPIDLRQRAFTLVQAERILRVGRSDIEPKDFALGINRLAEGVRRAQIQRVVQEPPVEA